MHNRLGHALRLGACASFLLALTPAIAQDSGVETVVVTGSRIARPEADMPNPTVSLSSDDLKHSGTINLTDYLKRIPALAGSLGSFQTSGYNTSVSSDGSSLSGLNLLDLRNLGYARTLVLVDGHRTVSESTGSTAVDTDSIPLTLIDRIDVVTGGSSAVYGADGVSGVVNFLMKHDLEGITARAQYGTSQDGGGEKYLGALSVGHNFDGEKGNVTLTYEMSREDNLYFTRRDFTKTGGYDPLVTNPANKDGTNPDLPANIFSKDARFTFSAPTGAIDADLDGLPDHLGNGQAFHLGTCLDDFCGSSIGSSGMPYAEDLQGDFQPTTNRRVAQASTHYDFAPWFKLSGEFKYAHVDTKSAENAPFDDDIMISADNAFLPANVAAAIAGNGFGEAALSEDYLGMRNSELVNRDTYRFVADASGDIPTSGFLSSLKYDVSYVYGQSNISDATTNNRIIDRFAASLDSVIDPATGKPTCRSNLHPGAVPPDMEFYFGDPTATYFSDTSTNFNISQFGTTFTPGANSGCIAFNPFDPSYNNKAALAWLAPTTSVSGYVAQEVLNGYFSAQIPAFKDWGFADALTVVIGGEYRKEKSKSTPEAITEIPDLFWIGGTSPVAGSFNVSEAFAEINMPVLADRPFAQELTFHGAGRLSHYSTAGDNQSWTLDGLWSPIGGVKFRGTDSVAVRAPNIGELFAPEQHLFSFINDPCDAAFIHNGTSFRAANCQLIENAVLGPGNYTAGTSNTETDQSTLTLSSGNPALKQEVARTLTLGTVVQPDFVSGLTVTADWYRVKINNAIELPSAQDISDECVDLSTIANPFCADVQRTATGVFPGSIKQVSTGEINVASYVTQGIDFTIDYHADLDDWFAQHSGTLDFHLIGNHLDTIKTTPLPGEAAVKSENTIAGGVDFTPTPNWQVNFDILWQRDEWTVDYNIDWYDGVLITDRQTAISEPNYVAKPFMHLSPRNVHSLQVGYDVRPGWNIYGGIDNLWYQKPSIGEDGYPVDPIGRFFYAGVKVDLDFNQL